MATLTELQARRAAAQTAIDNLISGGISEYQIDTGQSMQKVKKMNLTELVRYRDSIDAEIEALSAGGNCVFVDGGFR